MRSGKRAKTDAIDAAVRSHGFRRRAQQPEIRHCQDEEIRLRRISSPAGRSSPMIKAENQRRDKRAATACKIASTALLKALGARSAQVNERHRIPAIRDSALGARNGDLLRAPVGRRSAHHSRGPHPPNCPDMGTSTAAPSLPLSDPAPMGPGKFRTALALARTYIGGGRCERCEAHCSWEPFSVAHATIPCSGIPNRPRRTRQTKDASPSYATGPKALTIAQRHHSGTKRHGKNKTP